MGLWFRVGRNWGVTLGPWGSLAYGFGYLMWIMLVGALLVGACLVIAALFLIAVVGILAASVVTWAREPGEGYWSHAGPRLQALWGWVGRARS